MKIIWKESISLGDGCIYLPLGAKLLRTAWQGDGIVVWYEFGSKEVDSRHMPRRTRVVTTGMSFLDDIYEYFDTVMTPDETFVCHIYIETVDEVKRHDS